MRVDLIPSRTAAVAYPVHLILMPVAFTCFAGALLTDIAYSRTADVQWANFSAWLLAFGMLFGVLTALAGLVHVLRRPARSIAVARLYGIALVLGLCLGLLNNFVHSRDVWTSVVPTGLTLSALTVVVMLVTGWLAFSLVERSDIGGKL